MRVKLSVQLSGTRDGVPWPPIGSVVDLPDDEARDMLTSGVAKALEDKDQPESAVTVPDDVDEAVEKFIPETARHEPAVPIDAIPEEDRRPNMAAIGLGDDGEIGHGPVESADVSDEPVDMTAEATGEASRTRTPPTKRTTKSGPLTTKTGPTKTVPTDKE
jgi:hypothetical protein